MENWYEKAKAELTEMQFDLWWLTCAEASMCTGKEDMPEIEETVFNEVKTLTDEEALKQMEEL